MYLDRILGTKTKINILFTLISNQEKKFLESELSLKSGTSVSEVNRQIGDLVKVGIISLERMGRNKIYRINKKHFLFQPLKKIFLGLEKIYRRMSREIVNFITKKHKITTIILFGSLVKGTIRDDLVENPSDIDIAFVCKEKVKKKVKEALIEFISTSIAEKYGITIYPIVFSEGEYKEGLRNDSLIIELHSNGEVIYGEKPRRTG